MLTKQCVVCSKVFQKPASCGIPEWENKRKVCSRECANIWKLGSIPWNKGKKTGIIPSTAFKKGKHSSRKTEFKKGLTPWNKDTVGLMPTPWNKGKPMSEEIKKKIRLARKNSTFQAPRADKYWAWKEDVSYNGLHRRVRREWGRANHCVQCGKKEKSTDARGSFEWANISGKYKWDRNDWKQLYRSCHRKLDKADGFQGTNTEYQNIHAWVYRSLGKANHCEHCGTSKVPEGKIRWFGWANKSRQYRREIEDWMSLCRPCHERYDKRSKE